MRDSCFGFRSPLLRLACGILVMIPLVLALDHLGQTAPLIDIGGKMYPTQAPGLSQAATVIQNLSKKHEKIDQLLDESPSPRPDSAIVSQPSMEKVIRGVKKELDELERKSSVLTSQMSFSTLLEELKTRLNFRQVVPNAMVVSYYLKQLPTFISITVKSMDSGRLERLIRVFERTDSDASAVSERHDPGEPRSIIENYVSDDVLRLFTDKVCGLMAKAGVKLSPLITHVGQILYKIGLSTSVAKYFELVQGRVAMLMRNFMDSVPTQGARPFDTLRQFIESVSGSTSPGASLFSQKSIGILVEKMLMSIVESTRFGGHKDGLPTLHSLLSVLGPIGAFCLDLSLVPILQGLRPVIDSLLGAVNMLLDTQIDIPVLTLSVISEAREKFGHVPNANIFIPLSTSVLHWFCILSIMLFMNVSKEMSELAGIDFAVLRDLERRIWLTTDAHFNEVTRAAIKLTRDLGAASATLVGAPIIVPTSLYPELASDSYNRMTYLVGSISSTAAWIENMIDKSVKSATTAMFLRFPFSLIKLTLSFPMSPMPFRSTSNTLPEREQVLRKLADEKKDIYTMQQAAWLFGFFAILFPLVELPVGLASSGAVLSSARTRLLLGDLLSFMLGTLPQNLLLIWSLTKVIIVLEQEAIIEGAPNPNTYRYLFMDKPELVTETLKTLKTPYGPVSAQNIRDTLRFLHKRPPRQHDTEQIQLLLSEYINGASYKPTASGAQLFAFFSHASRLEKILPISFVGYTKQKLLSMTVAFLGKCNVPLHACHVISTERDWAILFNSIVLRKPFKPNLPSLLGEKDMPTRQLNSRDDLGSSYSSAVSSLSLELSPSDRVTPELSKPLSGSDESLPSNAAAQQNDLLTPLTPLTPLAPLPQLPPSLASIESQPPQQYSSQIEMTPSFNSPLIVPSIRV